MSLLMDALRRAEADKKKAQKDAAELPPGAEPGLADEDEDLAATVKLNRPPVSDDDLPGVDIDIDPMERTAPQRKSTAPADPLQAAAEEVLADLRACPPAPGFDRVEIPGEREREQRASSDQEQQRQRQQPKQACLRAGL